MFLDLNYGNQPSLLDKFRVRIVAGDEVAIAVDQITKSYMWKVTPGSGDGYIQAVGALEEIYRRSVQYEYEPNLLAETLRVLTKAWGNTADASNAVLFKGLAAFLGEHGSLIDTDSLIHRLQTYEGGPMALIANAKQLQATMRNRPAMAVAIVLTEVYNKSRSKNAVRPWSRRS